MKNRFLELDSLLQRHTPLWKPSAFTQLSHNQLEQYPDIAAWLETLSDREIDALQTSDTALLESAQAYFVDAARIMELISLPQLRDVQKNFPRFWEKDIPGRKVAQIECFSSAIMPLTSPMTEWCCGKFHLGRLLSEQANQSALGLEIDTQLVSQANLLTQKRQLDGKARVVQCDVLGEDVHHRLSREQHQLALHACGGLHVSMLKHSVEKKSARVSLSPCCYHRFNASHTYQALSEIGQHSSLILSNEDLRLATRQCNIASAAETRKRKQLQAWRLGFDQLQRDIRQVDEYLPCPSLSVKVLHEGFESFCHSLAKLKGLRLPDSLNYSAYESLGQQQFKRYERLELSRMLFRRALEIWLVLDRALFLEESGYHCKIVEFCDSSLSPRNLLIDAKQRS